MKSERSIQRRRVLEINANVKILLHTSRRQMMAAIHLCMETQQIGNTLLPNKWPIDDNCSCFFLVTVYSGRLRLLRRPWRIYFLKKLKNRERKIRQENKSEFAIDSVDIAWHIFSYFDMLFVRKLSTVCGQTRNCRFLITGWKLGTLSSK